MNQIERSLRKLRENFTRQVLKQGGYLNTFEEVDALFENKEGQLKSIRENELLKMKHRNITAKMTQQMMEMELIKAEQKEEKESKAKIKAALKLKQNVYNPILDDLAGTKQQSNQQTM